LPDWRARLRISDDGYCAADLPGKEFRRETTDRAQPAYFLRRITALVWEVLFLLAAILSRNRQMVMFKYLNKMSVLRNKHGLE